MWVGVGLVLTSSPIAEIVPSSFLLEFLVLFLYNFYHGIVATSSTWFSVSISIQFLVVVVVILLKWSLLSSSPFLIDVNIVLNFYWLSHFRLVVTFCCFSIILKSLAMSWQLANRLFTYASVTTTTSFSCNSDCIIIVRRSSVVTDCRSVLLLVGATRWHKQTGKYRPRYRQ